MKIEKCTLEDIPQLAMMNKQLIDDEKSNNPMTIKELEERMAGFLDSEGAGHIGYFIHKDYRGKGYGTEGLRLTLEIARMIIPENEIYLRVNKDNVASLQVMLNNGGYICREDDNKYYVRIKNRRI